MKTSDLDNSNLDDAEVEQREAIRKKASTNTTAKRAAFLVDMHCIVEIYEELKNSSMYFLISLSTKTDRRNK